MPHQEPVADSSADQQNVTDIGSLAETFEGTYPPELMDVAEAADFEEMFDDTPHPEAEDDLLIIDQGDPTRYTSAQDRLDDRLRQQRIRDASLNASAYVGDDRLQVISVLGTYAGEGNSDAVTELHRVLQSPDPELRADALEAVGELLSGSDVVPPFSNEPLSDSEVDHLIEALQARESSAD